MRIVFLVMIVLSANMFAIDQKWITHWMGLDHWTAINLSDGMAWDDGGMAGGGNRTGL